MTDRSGCFAVPYVHNDPVRFKYIVDKCAEHRAWFDDFVWEDAEARRNATVDYLAKCHKDGKLWEVYQGEMVVGVLLLNEVRYRTDAKCHFVFFDHKLADKRMICLNAMQWAFEHWQLHRLSIEIPTYAKALANFARKKLGFRYEAEARAFSWPRDASPLSSDAAALGSRKHQYTLYRREWHDVLLLSITREEFDDFVRSKPEARGEETGAVREAVRDGELPGPVPATDNPDQRLPETVAPESPASPSGDAADERPPAADWEDLRATPWGDVPESADGGGAGPD